MTRDVDDGAGRRWPRGYGVALRAARPSWPGRGEKVTPVRRGVLQRASVPVLGAPYARVGAPVQTHCPVRRFGYTAPMRELAPGTVVAGYRIEVAGRPRRDGRRLPRRVQMRAGADRGAEGDRARAARRRGRPRALPGRGAGRGQRRPPERDPGPRRGRGRRRSRSSRCATSAGSDLRSLVRARRARSTRPRRRSIVAQAGAALDAIHRAGLRPPRRQAREPARRRRAATST